MGCRLREQARSHRGFWCPGDVCLAPSQCGSELARDSGVSVAEMLNGPPPSLRCGDPTSQLLQGSVLGIIFVHGSDTCGSGLARDSGLSVAAMLNGPPSSLASQLLQGLCVAGGSENGGRQRESNLPGNGCRPQPGLKPGRATGRDCLPELRARSVEPVHCRVADDVCRRTAG